MKRVALVFGVLIGLALAFVLCGGMELAGKVSAAMNAQPVNVASLTQ